jgi:hypothetical protein
MTGATGMETAMNLVKRGMVTLAIVGTLVGGVASLPDGAAARAHPNQNGANCHGVEVSQSVEFEGTGIGNVPSEFSVQQIQRNIRHTCALIGNE